MIIAIFIPSIVVLLMVVVGTGLRIEQFRSVLHSPVPLIGGTLFQVLPRWLLLQAWRGRNS